MENGIIRLVPAEESLAELLADYCRRNRVFLRPYEPEREEAFFTVRYQRQILAREMENWRQKRGYRFYIFTPGNPDRIIGSIGLNNVVWGAFCSAHLGYKLDSAYLNRGYMTQAVAMVVAYAFEELGLHRIEGNVMPGNAASLRVLEKNGFVNEGISRYYLKINGAWEDHIHMVKLNEAMHL